MIYQVFNDMLIFQYKWYIYWIFSILVFFSYFLAINWPSFSSVTLVSQTILCTYIKAFGSALLLKHHKQYFDIWYFFPVISTSNKCSCLWSTKFSPYFTWIYLFIYLFIYFYVVPNHLEVICSQISLTRI